MAENEFSTPRASRIRIAFFGLRNAGKSTLVNEFCGQSIAIVSATPGTTTDPVSKAMEILPLGPCLITDTAGLDDEGELGALRVRKTLQTLAITDIAVWVESPEDGASDLKQRLRDECARRQVAFFSYRRGDSVAELRSRIAAVKMSAPDPALLEGLVTADTRVVLVCPIDAAAPKGRLILPQVAVLRECLDRHLVTAVCQVEELDQVLEPESAVRETLVITDSQAFKSVQAVVAKHSRARLTAFSILFARQKGDLAAYIGGLEAVARLKDGDTVLIAEGCTHHRQCNDIGTVKIPQVLARLSDNQRLNLRFASGGEFELDAASPVALVVHCGGCMLTRREMQRRIALCRTAGVPIVNYGLLLALAAGIDIRTLASCEK